MQSILLKLLPVLLVAALLAVACEGERRLPAGAVVLDFSISEQEARDGCAKTVRAPDGRFYQIAIPAGIRHETPLQLPPKVAERYDYPLYFRVLIRKDGEKAPGAATPK